jgi:hypothetical protein
VQSNEIFAVLAIALSLIAIAGLAVVWVTLKGYRRNQRVIMGSRGTVDVAEHMAIVDDKLTNLRLAVEDLTLTARDHGVRIDGTLSHAGIVRFDAYRDLGGRQSTAVAFMNTRNDGVVITTVVSREFARMYVKLVKDGVGDIPLAPEENEAVLQARRATPFVIKPVVDTVAEEVPTVGSVPAGLGETEPMVASLPGPYEREDQAVRMTERENRRRRREGMELIEHADLAPSTQGWAAPDTPVPAGASMAEQFVQQRKRGKKSGEPVEDATGEIRVQDHDDEWTAATVVRDDQSPTSQEDDGWGFKLVDDDTHEL